MSLNMPNLDKLIAHLEAQPPERINMGHVYVEHHGDCGTCGCILGHMELVFKDVDIFDEGEAGLTLGLSERDVYRLAHPRDWRDEQDGVRRYPAHRVIATLKRLRDRFLATGEIVVDWGPEPTAGEAWAAPRVAEIPGWFEVVAPPDPPALPETLTRLLAAQREEA